MMEPCFGTHQALAWLLKVFTASNRDPQSVQLRGEEHAHVFAIRTQPLVGAFAPLALLTQAEKRLDEKCQSRIPLPAKLRLALLSSLLCPFSRPFFRPSSLSECLIALAWLRSSPSERIP